MKLNQITKKTNSNVRYVNEAGGKKKKILYPIYSTCTFLKKKKHQKVSYAVTRTFHHYLLSVINLPSLHLAFIFLTELLICRKCQPAYGLFTVGTNLWHSHRQAHFVKVWNNDRQNLYCQSGTRCCQDHKIFHHFNEQLTPPPFFFLLWRWMFWLLTCLRWCSCWKIWLGLNSYQLLIHNQKHCQSGRQWHLSIGVGRAQFRLV